MIDELAKIGLAAIGVVAVIIAGMIALVVGLYAIIFVVAAATFPVWFPFWSAVQEGEREDGFKKWRYLGILAFLWLPGCYLWWQIVNWVRGVMK